MSNRFTDPLPQFLDANGDPYAGGSLEFYESGTSTPLATYSDQALTTPNSNPLDLDSAGRTSTSVFLEAKSYKVILKDSDGVTVWEEDPVTSALATTSNSITYTGNFTGATAVNLRDELDRRSVTPHMFGTVDGDADDVQIQAAIDAVAADGGGTVFCPNGAYAVASTIRLKQKVYLFCSEGAVFTAQTGVDVMLDTPVTDRHRNGLILGGKWDCNNIADTAFYLRNFSNFRVVHTEIERNTGKAIILGDSAASSSSYEFIGKDIWIFRATSADFANTVGIFFENAGDSHLDDVIVIGCERGVDGTYFDGKFDRVHVWSVLSTGALVNGFRNDGGGQTIYSQCQVDGPVSDACYIVGDDDVLSGCSTNGSNQQTDNTAPCVRIPTGSRASVIGCTFKANAGSRWSADITGDTTNVTALGNISKNVVSVFGAKLPSVYQDFGSQFSGSPTSLNDDAATSFDVPSIGGVVTLQNRTSADAAVISYKVNGTTKLVSQSGSSFAVTDDTALAGTTGTDGVTTVSFNSSDGRLYIENREGFNAFYVFSINAATIS